ncbi:MAG TPA: YraN family protein [Phycicoccus sp.]|nr:YraN family protein [Phycicoccus sp.]
MTTSATTSKLTESTPTGPPGSRPTQDRRSALGRAGEQLAARHLVTRGMTLLAENWRCREGEIDLVLVDHHDLVICEVKTRRTESFGDPLEAITVAKVRRLRRLAAIYVRTEGPLPGHRIDGLRIDAVGILWPRDERPRLRYVRGVGS